MSRTISGLLLALLLASTTLPQAPEPAAPPADRVLWTIALLAPSFGSGAIADLEGDGRSEVVFGAYFNDEVFRCLDARTGAVRWASRSRGGPLDASVLVADLDGEKGLEVVYADSAKGTVWCRDAAGRERWVFEGPSGTDSPPAAADLDGDGKPEIVYGTMKVKGGAGRVVALEGATGKLRWMVEVPGHIQSEPALVDLDGDGDLEVLVTNWMGDGRLRALDGRTGRELWQFATDDWVYHGVSAFDRDGDGKAEIVVADRGGRVWMLKGTDGAVLWKAELEGEAKGMVFGPTSLVDSDGEGPPEIVVCGRHVHVLDAEGKRRWRRTYGPRSIARGVAVADLDGDGAKDLVFGTGGVLRALRARDGEEILAFDLATAPEDHIDHAPLIDDLDGDGRLDVFVVVGRGRSGPTAKENRGRAWALRAGAGSPEGGNRWTTFRGSNRRTGGAWGAPPR
ncbi:MAG: PQQ-binding-like beta-propeller repeat protein [Planctomycetota bacterium]